MPNGSAKKTLFFIGVMVIFDIKLNMELRLMEGPEQ